MQSSDLFIVKENPELGRYAVASKILCAGDVFLNEIPFAYGPKPDSPVICLECYGPTDSMCANCGWPLCDNCTVSPRGHRAECELFKARKIHFYGQTNNEICSQLDCITPLRVLLARDDDPERFEREVAPMEYHDEERRQTRMFQVDQNNVVNYLRKHVKLEYSDELIQQVLGVLSVNAFEARSLSGFALRVLYPKLAILAHSCVPNTAHTIFPSDGYRMVGRVTIDVDAGNDLNSCYTYTSHGTVARQTHLREGKYFTCHCARCLDPTELGTHCSTMKCRKCEPGLVVPVNPLDDETMWKCTHCEYEIACEAVAKILAVIQDGLEDVLSMDYNGNKLEILEAFLKKYQNCLHPSHFILITVRHNLLKLYGRVSGYKISELTEKSLERMIEICKDILRVTDVVEPGLTRTRAMLLYEMHVPMIMLAKTKLADEKITEHQYKEKLCEVYPIVMEALKILEYEDPKSSEGTIASIIRKVHDHLVENISSA